MKIIDDESKEQKNKHYENSQFLYSNLVTQIFDTARIFVAKLENTHKVLFYIFMELCRSSI